MAYFKNLFDLDLGMEQTLYFRFFLEQYAFYSYSKNLLLTKSVAKWDMIRFQDMAKELISIHMKIREIPNESNEKLL